MPIVASVDLPSVVILACVVFFCRMYTGALPSSPDSVLVESKTFFGSSRWLKQCQNVLVDAYDALSKETPSVCMVTTRDACSRTSSHCFA